MTPDNKLKYRNASGARYLNGLFFEMVGADKSSVLYTMKDEDHLGFPSLYKLYMEMADPTEYRFATAYLDGWEHWEILTQCSWFKETVDRWRRELEVSLKSKALARVITISQTAGKESFAANRYLLDGPWKPAGASKRGRPSKEAIIKEATSIVAEANETAQDYKRLLGDLN